MDHASQAKATEYRCRGVVFRVAIILMFGGLWGPAAEAHAQLDLATDASDETETAETKKPPARVDVEPVAEDAEIGARLQRILTATEWFTDPQVRVEEGIVFLSGEAKTPEQKAWASELAGNTQDVVAVANRMTIAKPSAWDFAPAREEIDTLRRNAIQSLPTLIVAIGLMFIFWIAAKLFAQLSRKVAARRTSNSLLREVMAKAVAIPVLLLGIYLALRISGLTRLAATVLGGTGLLGIVLGIAFRDIAENFLASILLSVQRPFQIGDMIIVEGRQGFVQSVTTRGTTMMTLDGNHVQIPNSTIYKSIIENITANPNQRQFFIVGVDYEDPLEEVQQVIYTVLKQHVAVLADPEPLVLVDELAASTVNLRVYFWLNNLQHSALKVRSSLIRLVKKALVEHGFTLPDESREVIFPKGVPVRMLEAEPQPLPPKPTRRFEDKPRELSTAPEGDLVSDAAEIKEQAKKSRRPEAGENLLQD